MTASTRTLLRWVAVAVVALTPVPALAEEISGKVLRVESGDTLVLDDGARPLVVRLADIGAPQGSDFYAPAARTLLSNMVVDANVRVVVTGRKSSDSVYGRVFVGKLDVNRELVRRGAAWLCIEYAPTTDLLPYQNEAQRDRRGLWGTSGQMSSFEARMACRQRAPAEKPVIAQ